MKWKELAVNRMLLVMIKKRANTFFMIVRRKVLKAAEVFVTTVKRWSQGRNINQKIALMDMAAAMGIELLTEEQYRELQKLGDFDTKTSSWVKTPSDIRKLGGAIFCDRRYDTCLRVSQRCRILLCRQGIPWLAKGLNSTHLLSTLVTQLRFKLKSRFARELAVVGVVRHIAVLRSIF